MPVTLPEPNQTLQQTEPPSNGIALRLWAVLSVIIGVAYLILQHPMHTGLFIRVLKYIREGH